MDFARGHAVVIGIADYFHLTPLPQAVAEDAARIHRVLCSREHCSYSCSNVRILQNRGATRESILAALQELVLRTQTDDTAIFYFSGHGWRVNDEGFLLAYDSDLENLEETAISSHSLSEWFRKIKASRLLIILDCCYAGCIGSISKRLTSDKKLPGRQLDDIDYTILATGIGRVIIASSRSDEESIVNSSQQNSLFTSYLLEALEGKVCTKDREYIRVMDLFTYVSEKLSADGRQHTVFKSEIENNFPVAPCLSREDCILELEDRQFLRDFMVRRFSEFNLKVLATNLGLRFVINLSAPRVAIVEDLIDESEQRNELHLLVNEVNKHRPSPQLSKLSKKYHLRCERQ